MPTRQIPATGPGSPDEIPGRPTQHALAAAARSQLGNVLFDRGRLQRMLAGQYEGAARQKYLEAARELLRQADDIGPASIKRPTRN